VGHQNRLSFAFPLLIKHFKRFPNIVALNNNDFNKKSSHMPTYPNIKTGPDFLALKKQKEYLPQSPSGAEF
jgi:hypothetical protein